MSIFNFALREMNDLLQQNSAKCQLQISEVRISKSEVQKQKNKVDDMKYAIMKKEEYGKTALCGFSSGWLTVNGHIAYIHILKSDHIEEIKNTDQHTLTPV